jgi:hypothetical protein
MRDRIKSGDKVIYIPKDKYGNLDCQRSERGIISSFNDSYVFVKYIRDGILQETSQGTRYEDLYLEL